MINLPKIVDPRGNLSFIEHGPRGVCPFEMGSVSWVYDVPAGSPPRPLPPEDFPRLVIAISGSFDVVVGASRTRLSRSDRAILIPPHTAGCALHDFATNSVALIISAEHSSTYVPAADDGLAHASSNIADVRILTLPRLRSDFGSVSVADPADASIPFPIHRVFYLFDVPADAERGGHSHHTARELIIALSGSFDVVLSDGRNAPRRFSLNRPYYALYVPIGLWRTLDNFSGGAVCMVLTSERYSEEDYVRSHPRFLSLTASKTWK